MENKVVIFLRSTWNHDTVGPWEQGCETSIITYCTLYVL